MTHIIRKTRLNLPDDVLKNEVEKHARELDQWTENMRLYEEEQKTPPPEEPTRDQFEDDETYTEAYVQHADALTYRRQKYPPPSTHPEIDEAVARSVADGKAVFTPDYDVVDDLPPVVETSELDQLKRAYVEKVHSAEGVALAKLSPPGKTRAHQLRVHDIYLADLARTKKMVEELANLKPEDFAHAPLKADIANPDYHNKQRPAEDTAFLAEQKLLQEKRDRISRVAAQMTSDIEDLTEDNVHSWTLGSFE